MILNSWAEGTKKRYKPHILRWIDYCTKKSIDPFNASVYDGAEFLVNFFRESGNGYSSLNTARSAISAIIRPTDSVSFGEHPLITRLLKGMFRERPSLRKYIVTYDAKSVLDYIKSFQRNFDLKMLTKCLVTLMCLLCGQRVQTMSALRTDYMHIDSNSVVFYVPSLLKTTRPGFHQEPLKLMAYHDKDICPLELTKMYLDQTKQLRSNDKTGLFLSYKAPHSVVVSTTLARYVCSILSEAGIDVKTFAAHSTRSASTSKVSKTLSLTEINKAAGWTNCTTFANHYNCQIEENFGTALLNSCT